MLLSSLSRITVGFGNGDDGFTFSKAVIGGITDKKEATEENNSHRPMEYSRSSV